MVHTPFSLSHQNLRPSYQRNSPRLMTGTRQFLSPHNSDYTCSCSPRQNVVYMYVGDSRPPTILHQTHKTSARHWSQRQLFVRVVKILCHERDALRNPYRLCFNRTTLPGFSRDTCGRRIKKPAQDQTAKKAVPRCQSATTLNLTHKQLQPSNECRSRYVLA